MALVPIFNGRVNDEGALVLFDTERTQRRAYLRTLAGKDVEIVVRKKRSQRSVDQNAYWWAVPVRLLAEHCGYSDDDMHYALLGECFGYKVGPTGHQMPNVSSSSRLSTEEFTRLIEWVLVWGPTEMQVDIPSPERVAA